MAGALCCALGSGVCFDGATASFSGRAAPTLQQAGVVQNRSTVPFQSRGGGALSFSRSGGPARRIVRCAASGGGGAEGKSSSCCGGSGSGSGGGEEGQSSGKCSSHGVSKSAADLSGVGKEFEALVAQKTMEEFEAQYESSQMQGTISRDIITDVVNVYPEAVATKTNEEKFLDVEELLAEARAMSSKDGDFIFDADFEDMLV